MSSRNDDSSGAILAISLVGAALMLFALFIYALAVFGAFILTVLCLIAWDKRLTLGSIVIEPEEARFFILRGIVGAIALPVFAAFVCALFGGHIQSDWWVHIVLAGYAAGSLGIECLMAQEAAQAQAQANASTYVPPAPVAPPPPALPSRPAAPFQFASWDDEEDR